MLFRSREAAGNLLVAEKRVLMREFEKRNPPSFSGDQGPLATEDWLQRINRIFDFILLEDNATRINAASLMFMNEALQWWNCTLGTHLLAGMTWATFERLFLKKYFPEDNQNAMQSEFFNLK